MTHEKNNLWMQDLGDRFRLYNVCLDDRLWTVDQSTELLDGGITRTQGGWIEWLNSEENKNNWQLASGPLYHASLAALHYNQDHPNKKQRELIKQCRAMHAENFLKYWMMTSTIIIYATQGKDKIIHDYGTDNAEEIKLNLVGPNKYINKESSLGQEITALLGTNDLEEVEHVYDGLAGKKLYLWRKNNKPIWETYRALVLGVTNGNFSVDADDFTISDRPTHGWSIILQGAPVYDSSLRGALSLVGDAGDLSLADTGNLSFK